jgi:hypothetical protein
MMLDGVGFLNLFCFGYNEESSDDLVVSGVHCTFKRLFLQN